MKIRRGAILLILGILITSSCSRYLGNSTDDWHSYTNEVYGYSFSYPTDCYFGRMPRDCKEKPPEERRQACLCFLDSTDPNRVFLQAFLGEGAPLSLASFDVSHADSHFYNPPEGTELTNYLKANISEMFEEIPDEPNMEFNGVPAVRVYSPGSSMAPSIEEIYYIQNDMLFRIQLLEVDNEDNKDLYEQIL